MMEKGKRKRNNNVQHYQYVQTCRKLKQATNV